MEGGQRGGGGINLTESAHIERLIGMEKATSSLTPVASAWTSAVLCQSASSSSSSSSLSSSSSFSSSQTSLCLSLSAYVMSHSASDPHFLFVYPFVSALSVSVQSLSLSPPPFRLCSFPGNEPRVYGTKYPSFFPFSLCTFSPSSFSLPPPPFSPFPPSISDDVQRQVWP